MIEISNVGKQPALRHVMSCPFCNFENRGILLNVGIVPSARELYTGDVTIEIHKYPDQQLFLFGREARSRQPCEHVALFWGSCGWTNDDPQHSDAGGYVEFDYSSPSRLSQANGNLEVYLDEVVGRRRCGKQFLPTVLVRCRKINKQWKTPATSENPAWVFQFRVWAYFGLDVPGLFDELKILEAAYHEHCATAAKTGNY